MATTLQLYPITEQTMRGFYKDVYTDLADFRTCFSAATDYWIENEDLESEWGDMIEVLDERYTQLELYIPYLFIAKLLDGESVCVYSVYRDEPEKDGHHMEYYTLGRVHEDHIEIIKALLEKFPYEQYNLNGEDSYCKSSHQDLIDWLNRNIGNDVYVCHA